MSMLQPISCHLCINICNGHHNLCDEDGRRNEVYALTEKYFAPLLLNLECVDNCTVICMECWRHIFEFHSFQQSVLLAQKMIAVNKRTEDALKSEVDNQQDEEEFITIRPKSIATYTQRHNEVPKALTNANTLTCSQYRVSCTDGDAEQQCEDIVKSEEEGTQHDGVNEYRMLMSTDDNDDQHSETIVKSEVQFIEYIHTSDYVSRNSEVLTNNTASMFTDDFGKVSSDDESKEPEDPDEEWEELDEPVVVFTGGEFDNDERETTNSASDESAGSFSSDDEIPLAVTTRQGNTEPNMTIPKDRESMHANSLTTLGGKAKSKSENNKSLKRHKTSHEFNALKSDSEGFGGNLISDDDISLHEAKGGNLEEVQHIKDNLVTVIDGNPQRKVKSEHNKRMRKTHKTSYKLPQTTAQEYDDFIAEWRPDLECVMCSASCSTFSFLQQHFDKQHPDEKCHITCCQIKLYGRHEIEKHIHSHSKTTALKCELCSRCFTLKSNLYRHKRVVHSAKPEGVKSLTNNIKDVSNTDNNLRSKQQGSKGHTCSECGQLYKTLSGLQRHKSEVHLGISKTDTMKCTICDKGYNNRHSLREHMGSHAGKPMFTCKFCPKSYMYRPTLNIHLKKVHPKEWEEKMENLKCTICGKVFRKLCGLNNHMASHAGEQTYSCSFCSNTFKYKSSLYKHLNKMHCMEWEEKKKGKGNGKLFKAKEKKIHKCTICEKVFRNSNSLYEHLAWHEGRVLYNCMYCPKTFVYSSNFSIHLKKNHSEERQKKK